MASKTNQSAFSSKVLPLIILVVLPPIFLALPDIADYYNIDIPNDQIFWPSLLVAIFAIYILYPARLSDEKYFKKNGPVHVLILTPA